jgi:ABC-type transport system involved in multi-copper enzyme maturation permease subunit
MVRRPANWLLLAIAVILGLLFTYVIAYAGYAGGTGGPRSTRGLAALLPDQLVGNSIAGLPVFLGAIVTILGVLTVGSEYAWGTWKTVLAQGPGRMTVLAAKFAALALAALGFVVVLFAVGAGASALIAVGENEPLHWPAAADVVTGIGAGWLIASMWAAFGAALAVLLRGVALPIGLGLVWLLAVQNLLALLAAPLLDWVAQMQKGLPGPNAGSLAAALGSGTDTPGVQAVVGGASAAAVIAAYLVGFVVVSAAVLRRRDIL